MAHQKFETDFVGKTLTIETGHVAEQANGALTIRCGDTMLLVTAVASKEPREGIDFFPLTCDYEEKLYAAGKIPGGFIRREGRPTEAAILAARMTDRPLRPLFPDGFRNDIQVVSTVLSADQENDTAIMSISGASTALTISDIPFHGPVGAVRVGLLDGQLSVNPPMSRMEESELDLVVAGTGDAILMVEAGARGVTEQQVVDALDLAHAEIRRLCEAQLALREEAGKPKYEPPAQQPPAELVEVVGEWLAPRLDDALYNPDKAGREGAVDDLKREMRAILAERFPEQEDLLGKIFEKKVKDRVRQRVIEDGVRAHGRGLKD